MTAIQIYRNIQAKLQHAGIPDPDVEAGILISYYLQISRSDIFLNPDCPVLDKVIICIDQAVNKRLQRVPLSYVIGEQYFWSRPFKVTPDVLIPRSETEILVEKVIAAVGGVKTCKILDLGTGSGVIPVTLALECGVSVVSVDLSFAALRVAQVNIVHYGVQQQVLLVNADWHSFLKPCRSFDIVVSNPPYVARSVMDSLQPELAHEPALALFGGYNGLTEIVRIFNGLEKFVKPGGWVFMEIGFDQAAAMVDMLNSFGKYDTVMVHNDYAGLPRIVQARSLP